MFGRIKLGFAGFALLSLSVGCTRGFSALPKMTAASSASSAPATSSSTSSANTTPGSAPENSPPLPTPTPTSNGGTNSGSNVPYPRTGIQFIGGGQADISPSNYALAAQYDIVYVGSDWETWGDSNRHDIFAGIKSVQGPLTSSLRLVGQYVIFEIAQGANGGAANAYAHINANSWWLFNSGTSGSVAMDGSAELVNYSTFAPRDANGDTPYQWYANYVWDTYALGEGGPVHGANPHNNGSNADFFYFDNTIPMEAFSGDWERSGSEQGALPGPSPVITAIQQAQATLCPAFRKASDNKMCFINQSRSWAVDSYGVNVSSLNGAFDGTMQQFIWGQTTNSSYEHWGGFSAMMRAISDQIQSGAKYVMLTGPVSNRTESDFQYFRYVFAANTLDDGYAFFGLNSYISGSDIADGSNTSTWANFDEFSGGSIQKHGWLGLPLSTAQGKSWTNGNSSPWQNGTYRRDFQNGIVIVNPRGNGARTVHLETTYYHLRGQQAPSVNNGQVVTSVTLQDGDGVFLSRKPVP